MSSANTATYYPYPTPGVTDQRLTVDDTAGGVQFATAFNEKTRQVMFDVQDYDVMCTIDGSAPTTTNGHKLTAGSRFTWSKEMATAAKFIRLTANSATIHASELTQ